jgi:prepilin-type N-terminal cleavage/methylation domain-containing protein
VQQSKGFTLLELMGTLVISTVLLSALFLIFHRFQMQAGDMNLLAERDQNLRLVPAMLAQWIAVAGNNRWNQSWEGVSLDSSLITVRSDTNGNWGFPDGDLDESYEEISFRHRENNLVMRSGSGFFQPVLKNIETIEGEKVRPDALTVRLIGSTNQPLASTGMYSSEPFEVKIHLWNYRANLFRE